MNNWTIFKLRVIKESPTFFKKLRNIALYIGGSAAGVLFTITTFNLIVPAIVTTICTWVLIASASVAGTSILPVKNPAELEQPTQNNTDETTR
jgi:hypothetical protein